MNNSTRIVEINELKESMVVAKDVEQDGHVLLKKDMPVTNVIIQKLRKTLFFGTIEIYDNDGQTDYLAEAKKIEVYKKVEEEFNEISIRLQRTFRIVNSSSNSKSAVGELKEFSERIKNEMKPSSVIIRNIVLKGSGTDTIYRHGVNVAALSALIGEWVGVPNNQINKLIYSAMLHDFGKVKVDKKILNKVEPLTNTEYDAIKKHPQIGYKMLKNVEYLDKSILYGVLMHHERENGSGYPLGIKANEIHKFAKIIAIADVFDAINSNRGYKKKKAPFEALQIVKSESLGNLNYEYCKIFIEHIVNYYLGEKARLSNKKVCKIIQMNVNNLDRPLVLIDDEFIDLTKEKDLYVEELVM